MYVPRINSTSCPSRNEPWIVALDAKEEKKMRRNIIRSGIYNSFVPMDSRELFTFRFLIKIPRSREGASLSRIERKVYESLRFSFHFQFETFKYSHLRQIFHNMRNLEFAVNDVMFDNTSLIETSYGAKTKSKEKRKEGKGKRKSIKSVSIDIIGSPVSSRQTLNDTRCKGQIGNSRQSSSHERATFR